MRTFETENGNIPEGATHYTNESKVFNFCWFKGVGSDKFSTWPVEGFGNQGWYKESYHERCYKAKAK